MLQHAFTRGMRFMNFKEMFLQHSVMQHKINSVSESDVLAAIGIHSKHSLKCMRLTPPPRVVDSLSFFFAQKQRMWSGILTCDEDV